MLKIWERVVVWEGLIFRIILTLGECSGLERTHCGQVSTFGG